MVHYWAQTGEIRGPSKRAENALRRAIEASGIDRAEYWPDGGHHEGSLAIQVDGGGGVRRDDTEEAGWITGHYDYQYWMLDGQLWIDDLKTGKYYPNPGAYDERHNPAIEVGANRYPQDVTSPQIKTYALALSELFGYKGEVLVSVTHWPRLPLSHRLALPTRTWHAWSHSDLMWHWRELEMVHDITEHNRKVMTGLNEELILNPGDHCRFCPSLDCFSRQEF